MAMKMRGRRLFRLKDELKTAGRQVAQMVIVFRSG